MPQDQYVENILAKYAVDTGPYSPAVRTLGLVIPVIRQWAGTSLANVGLSGSYAKGTPVHGGTDLDIFISLTSATPETLGQIYNSLYSLSQRSGWVPRRQDVSIGTTIQALSVDLVPGKIQAGQQNYHSLYRNKTGKWTQANIASHINTVRTSGRTKEIRAIKIWRNLHRLDFESFYLELMVIEALKGRATNTLAANVLHALRYIGANLATARIVDPANTNNIISADYTDAEKRAIAAQATQSANQRNWEQIIW